MSIVNPAFDDNNTRVLLDYVKGQSLYVADGKLKVRGFFGWLYDLLFTSGAEMAQRKKQVKEVVSSLLGRVQVIEGGLLNSGNVNAFVFEKIFPMHHSLCDVSAMQKNNALREVIEERVNQLLPEVEKDPNIVQCIGRINEIQERILQVQSENFQALSQSPTHLQKDVSWLNHPGLKLTDAEKKLKRLNWCKDKEERFFSAVTRAFLGLKMNLNHETGAENNGWSGSFFWRDYLTNKKIGVYKPSDQDSISPGSPHWVARWRLMSIPRDHGVIVAQAGKSHIAEVGAHICAEAFHKAYLDIQADGCSQPLKEDDAVVPDTRIVHVGFEAGQTPKGVGSFQIFLENSESLADALNIDKRTFAPKGNENQAQEGLLPHYQWLKLLHYLIFAQDDHAENTLVIRDSNGDISAMKGIDNGQSFPCQPLANDRTENSVLSMKPMFGLKHPLSKEKIDPFFKKFLSQFEELGYFKKLCNDLSLLYQDPNNYPEGKVESADITKGRIDLLQQRFSTLQKLFVHQDQPLAALQSHIYTTA